MNHIKNILVPLDFTETSLHGLNAAIVLAEKLDSKIHLGHFVAPTHVVPGLAPEAGMASMGLLQEQHKHAIENAKTRLNVVMNYKVPKAHQGEILAVSTSIYDNFEMLVNQAEVDLVVSGTSGSRDILEWFVGNKTENMIRHGEVPVLAVSDDQDLALDKVMIATDLSTEIPEKLFNFCKVLADRGAKVQLVNIMTTELIKKEEVIYKINKLANKNGLTHFQWNVKKHKSEVEGLLEVIDEEKPDLLLMKTYEKSRFWSLFSGRLAEKTIRKTDVPTMVEQV